MAKRYSARMNKSVQNVLDNAIKKLEEHYGEVLVHWSEATPDQKRLFIEHSPTLRQILDWSAQWRQELQ